MAAVSFLFCLSVLSLVGCGTALPPAAPGDERRDSLVQHFHNGSSEPKPWTRPLEPGYFQFFSSPRGGLVAQYLLTRGWEQVLDPLEASLLWYKRKSRIPYQRVQPWQRANHFPGEGKLGHKGDFLGLMLGLPPEARQFMIESYRLWISAERAVFLNLTKGGYMYPWIAKNPVVDGGKGVTLVGDQASLDNLRAAAGRAAFPSPRVGAEATSATESMRRSETTTSRDEKRAVNAWDHGYLIAQRYLQNPMLLNGRKFDLRVYWLIASLDPLIVLYRDGTLRVSLSKFTRDRFNHVGTHLTNAVVQKTKSNDFEEHKEMSRVSFVDFEAYLQVNQSPHFGGKSGRVLVEELRCKMQQALLSIVQASRKVLLKSVSASRSATKMENAFSLLGADFMVDTNLDIWITEVQSGPGLPTNTRAVAEVMDSMIPEAMDIVLEIRERQLSLKPTQSLRSIREFDLLIHEEEDYKQAPACARRLFAAKP